MKPNEARARRRMAETVRRSRSDALREYLESGDPKDRVMPELIPTEEDRGRLQREVRRLARRAEKQPRGAARNRKLDEVVPLVRQLVAVGKVLELDRLERAALTPRRLDAIARGVTVEEMQAMVASLAGHGPGVVS